MECTQYLHELSHISTFSYVLISHYSFTPPLKAANKESEYIMSFSIISCPPEVIVDIVLDVTLRR